MRQIAWRKQQSEHRWHSGWTTPSIPHTSQTLGTIAFHGTLSITPLVGYIRTQHMYSCQQRKAHPHPEKPIMELWNNLRVARGQVRWKKLFMSQLMQLRICTSPWVEVKDRSPLCSKAYNKLNPHVTLCGSCFVTKSSSMPYSHFFLISSKEWLRSFSNFDSIICKYKQY